MNCIYCQQPCHSRASSQANARWHNCPQCRVNMHVHYTPYDTIIQFVDLWTDLGERKYIMRLNTRKQTTAILQVDQIGDGNYSHSTVWETNKLIWVFPQTVNDKIKTFLTFL